MEHRRAQDPRRVPDADPRPGAGVGVSQRLICGPPSCGATIRVVVGDGPHRVVDRGELESRLPAGVRAGTAGSGRIGRLFASMHNVSNNDLDALLHVILAETSGAPL